jgi:hypothetical protein
VVPTADLTSSTCSNNSAVVFTPVVPDRLPIEHVADDRESGAASSARCREGGQEYVSHPPEPHAVLCENGTLPFVIRRTVEVVVDGAPHRTGHNTPRTNESVLASREGGTSAESENSHLPHLPHLPHLALPHLPHLPHLPLQQHSAAFAGTPFLATELSLARTSRFRRWR